jgi:hypothetical protein
MGVLRVCWYVVLALVTVVRYVVASPLVIVWIGADRRGDTELTDRIDRWLERVTGTPQR